MPLSFKSHLLTSVSPLAVLKQHETMDKDGLKAEFQRWSDAASRLLGIDPLTKAQAVRGV